MFLTGVANLISSGYVQSFLELMASVYPGYQATASFGQVLIQDGQMSSKIRSEQTVSRIADFHREIWHFTVCGKS